VIVLKLPIPPSINAAYANQRKGWGGRGRYKTAQYKTWEREADALLLAQRGWAQVTDARSYALHITLPSTMRGDITNRIKVLEDYLVSRAITPDDRHNHETLIRKSSAVDCCEVTIKGLTG